MDYKCLANKSISFCGREKFDIETYLPTIDTRTLITKLKNRGKPYISINKRFGFVSNLNSLETK